MVRRRVIIGAMVLVAACSSSREARQLERPAPPTSTTAPATGDDTAQATASTPVSSGAATSTTATSRPPPSTTAANTVTGTAVAGSLGGVEVMGRPFRKTDPFSEAVRLRDGSCVGWSGARGGSTAGLAVGASVLILDAEANEEIGRGRIEASRWGDMSNGGKQWNCMFDFSATITGSPAEFRIRVASLEPWLARPDPTDPETFVASVSTDASIGLIRSCPAVPEESPATTEVASTTRPRRRVSGWKAVGQYWSRGVASLCKAGLPVTAIARPCRSPGVGSEYIERVVDSGDSTVTYPDGATVLVGTEMTVVVATGRLCE